MGEPRLPVAAKLFCGMLTARPPMFDAATQELESLFGPIDYASEVLPFDQTTYYDQELGTPIQRQFISFESLIEQERLAQTKILTNSVEQALSQKGKRLANLDPGYLTASKVVLATTKDYRHRIYIGDGVYAEVTLYYQGGSFQPWPWTYPDYRTPQYLDIFTHIRDIYVAQLRRQMGG